MTPAFATGRLAAAPRPRGAARAHACALALAASLAVPAAGAHAGTVEGLGASAPAATAALASHVFRGMDGGTLSLSGLRGQVVVVNFWASWCAPCRRELPRLAVLDAEIERQGGRVLAVSIDDDRRNVELFTRREQMRLPVFLDGSAGLARELDLRSVPVTLVLNRAGEIAYAGTRADAAGLDALVSATRRLVAERPVAARESEAGAR